MGKPSEKESKGSPGYIASHGLIRNQKDEQLFFKRIFLLVLFFYLEKMFDKSSLRKYRTSAR